MVITDKFVFIHMPKTGGTFVQHVLCRLYAVDQLAPRLSWTRVKWFLAGGNLAGHKRYGRIYLDTKDSRGTVSELQPQHRRKPILGGIRNPFDWYVSAYEFWRRIQRGPWVFSRFPILKEGFPVSDDLSFEELLGACWKKTAEIRGKDDMGMVTFLFLRLFFRDWRRVVCSMEDGYFREEEHGADISNARFLRTERLNQELFDFLKGSGYTEEDLEFILTHDRILPLGIGRPAKDDWRHHYTPELIEEVRWRERFLLELFPEYDPPRSPKELL